MKKLLIIGCGRSGTKYTSVLLQGLGIDVGHEVMGRHGMVSWFATFENCCPLPGKRRPLVYHADFVVLHQVRHPLETISSLQTISEHSWERIYLRVPEIQRSQSLLWRCMGYWYRWNLIAEKKAILTFRVEDLNRWGSLPGIPSGVNSREHVTLDWASLQSEDLTLSEGIRELAARYGYLE